MFLKGLGTATPPYRYSQSQCWEAAERSPVVRGLEPQSQALLQRVLLGNSGIEHRHFAVASLEEMFELTPNALNRRFASAAPKLGAEAAERALADGEALPAEIDALLVSTCTGYLCPGLSGYISEAIGLRRDAMLLDFVGQGCGAAVPNLGVAESLIASGRCRKVLSVCIEICSAAFYLDNDPGVLISACIFGDGAGAVLLGDEPGPRRRVEWKGWETRLQSAERESLRFELRNGMLRNILQKQVPALAADGVGQVLNAGTERMGVRPDEVVGWVMHPGGREVLRAIRQKLGLQQSDLRWSKEILRTCGNMSSPSVIFVLQAALTDRVPAGLWWLSAFGAGFSCHGALLRVE